MHGVVFDIFVGRGQRARLRPNGLRRGGLRAAVELQSVYAVAPPRLRRARFALTAPGRLRHAEPVSVRTLKERLAEVLDIA